MIDRSPSEWQADTPAAEETSGESQREPQTVAADPSPIPAVGEAATRRPTTATAHARASRLPTVTAPESPATLEATGLTLLYIAELVLKHLYVQGNLLGVEIARNIRLPFQIVQESLRWLKDEKCVEVSSGDVIGPASYHFHLSEMGRRRAREAFEQCRYVGPAPIPLEDYIAQCNRQAVAGITCSEEALEEAFGDLIIRDGLLNELGPAIESLQSLPCGGPVIIGIGPAGADAVVVAVADEASPEGGNLFVVQANEVAGDGAS